MDQKDVYPWYCSTLKLKDNSKRTRMRLQNRTSVDNGVWLIRGLIKLYNSESIHVLQMDKKYEIKGWKVIK